MNQSKQLDRFIVINSLSPIKDFKFKLNDLRSRAESFVNLGIELPTDDLLKVIISKYFSDKQIEISPKISDFIIKNIERSYEKVFKFIKEIDELSLSSGKSININLIKKVLIDEKYRTHNCAELTDKDAGKDVLLSGWLIEKGTTEIYFLLI